MKCHICNGQLASDEIKHTPAYGRGGFAPCGTCLEKIEEIFEPHDEEEIARQLSLELFYEGLQDDTSSNVDDDDDSA